MFLRDLLKVTKVPLIIIKHTPVFDIPDKILEEVTDETIKNLIVRSINIEDGKLQVMVTDLIYLIV